MSDGYVSVHMYQNSLSIKCTLRLVHFIECTSKKKAAEFKMIKDNHDLQREKTINQISLKVVRNRVPNWNGQTKIFIAVAERKAFGDTSRKKTVFGMKGQNHILKYIVFF